MKKYISGLITGLLIASFSVYAISTFSSVSVLYDNSNGMQSTNVQDAIDELYSLNNTCISSVATIMNLGQVSTYDVKTYFPGIYNKLTADNFLVQVNSSSFSFGEIWNKDYSYGTAAASIGKSYDAATGTLTVTNTGLVANGPTCNSSYCAHFSIAQNYSVFLIYLPGGSGIFEKLGTNTSLANESGAVTFDAKTAYPNEYKKMTANDFIVQFDSSSFDLSIVFSLGDYNYRSPSVSLNKSYDADTGIFTLINTGGVGGGPACNSYKCSHFGVPQDYSIYLAHRK